MHNPNKSFNNPKSSSSAFDSEYLEENDELEETIEVLEDVEEDI